MTGKGPRHARRADNNHAQIVSQLRDIPGVYVQDVSRHAGLGFDLIVTCQSRRPGYILFVEVKNEDAPSDLTESERRARAHLSDNWIEAQSIEPILQRLAIADRPTPAPHSTSGPGRSVPQIAQSPLWKTALADLEMQMTRATFAKWLKDTTAIEDDDALTIHVANDYAIDWLANHLQPLIERTVNDTYGRPLTIRYEVQP